MKGKTKALRIKNLPIMNEINKIGDIYHGSSYVTCSVSVSLFNWSTRQHTFSISPSFSFSDIICKSLGLYLARCCLSMTLSSHHYLLLSSSTPGGRSPRSRYRPPSHPPSPPGSSPCCRGPPALLQHTRLTIATIVMGTEKTTRLQTLNYSICIKITWLHCKNKSTLVPPRCN